VPWLKAVQVSPDGKLTNLEEAKAGVEQDTATRGEVVLVAQLLGLLHTFIGEPLTLQLVKEAWPAITHDLSTDSHTL
jgi:hypothetical protein